MKKINLIVFTVLMFISFSINTYALNTPNGVEIIENTDPNDNTFALYCTYYNGSYILIDRGSTDDSGNIDSNAAPFDETSDSTLKDYNFMSADGSVDCPKFVLVDKKTSIVFDYSNVDEGGIDVISYGLNVSQSSCTGKCTGNQNSNVNDYWNCNYTGPSGNLITKYNGQYLAYYPNGDWSVVNPDAISSICPDIFYNKKTNEMFMASYDYAEYIKNNNNFDPKQHDYLCGSNKDDYEYFCSGSCKFPNNANIDCEKLTDKIEGININLGEICSNSNFKSALKFIGFLLFIAKILVPLLLIIFGIIDFSKVLMSSEADSIQKASKSLMIRIITGIVIFLIPTMVNYFFENIINSDQSRYNECRECIFNPSKC